MGNIDYSITNKRNDLPKELEKANRKLAKTEEKLQKVTRQSKAANRAARQGAKAQQGLGSTVAASVGGMITSYMSLSAAISAVNQGLEKQRELHSQTAEKQTTLASAEQGVIRNLGGASTGDVNAFLQNLYGISKGAGQRSAQPVMQAAADVLSATGGNRELTKGVLSLTAPMFRGSPDEIAPFSGAMADLATIGGVTSKEDLKKVLGLVVSTQSQARITSLESFKHAAPAIAAAASADTGADRIRAMKEGGALFAAIGGSIKDPEGALTKTATAKLATKLGEFLPEKDTLDIKGEVIRKGTGMKTLAERLAAVQADPNLQRRFLQGEEGFAAATFRAPIMPAIRQLITAPDSEASTRFTRAIAEIKPDIALVDQMQANLDKAGLQAGAKVEAEAEANLEAFDLQNSLGTRTGRVRKILDDTRARTRASSMEAIFGGPAGWVEDHVWTGMTDYTESPETQGIGLLLGEKERIRRGMPVNPAMARGYSGNMSDTLFPVRPDSQLSANERAELSHIDKQIRALEALAPKIDNLGSKIENHTVATGAAAQRGVHRE